VADPISGNNSATDIDTLAQADLAVSQFDSVDPCSLVRR
jgi:hypothetical protein